MKSLNLKVHHQVVFFPRVLLVPFKENNSFNLDFDSIVFCIMEHYRRLHLQAFSNIHDAFFPRVL